MREPSSLASKLWIIAILVLSVSCAQAPSAPRSGDASAPEQKPKGPSQIVLGMGGEPRVLSATLDSTTAAPFQIHEYISLGFTSIDADGHPIPKLIAEIPSIDNGSWRVPADGMVETTYRLRDNAFWHDGAAVTASDVDFSLRVYQDPKVPAFQRAMNAVDRVEVVDDRTFVLYWRQPYALADQITFREFTILPRHLLQSAYDQSPDALANSPYWGDSFVGSGPFRVQSWERGSHIDLAGFDRYFLGKPKIDRIIIRFVKDSNTMAAQVLAGDLDLTTGGGSAGLDASQAVELEPRVREAGFGEFRYGGNSYAHWTYQYNNHPDAAHLRDPRVRQAMARALDRVALANFSTAGRSPALDSWIPSDEPRYKDAEPYITKYPYDPTRAEAGFQEAGWTRGPDGMLRDRAGQPFRCVIRGAEQVGTLGVQQWRAAGIDASEEPIPPNLLGNPEWRATFQCVESSSRQMGISKITHLQSSNAMSPANGWKGNNRSGWSTPELDILIDRFTTAMIESDRLQIEREIVQLVSAELPLLPMYVSIDGTYVSNALKGWRGYKRGVLLDSSTAWNVESWERG